MISSIEHKQPRAAYGLFAVQMWECFSFYGMRALLVLYMVNELSQGLGHAFAVYGLYTALVEMGGLAGGIIADKILGLKRSIYLGSVMIFLGHSMLFVDFLYGGLACICVGSSLFKGNIRALLGALYTKEDPRREKGFTLFYAGSNIGGFLSTILCGILSMKYGWHIGLGLAALGMLIGICILFVQRSVIQEEIEKTPSFMQYLLLTAGLALSCCGITLSFTCPQIAGILVLVIGCSTILYFGKQLKTFAIEKKALVSLLGLLILLAFYFTFDELMGGMLMVFSEEFVERKFFGITLPSSSLIGINPLIVVLAGFYLSRKNHFFDRLGSALKLVLAFGLLLTAFSLLYIGSVVGIDKVSIVFPMVSFCCIALGELCIVPVIFSYCSKIGKDLFRGRMMSLVTMSFASASYGAGELSQRLSIETLAEYKSFFLCSSLAIGAVLVCLVLLGVNPKRNQAVYPI